MKGLETELEETKKSFHNSMVQQEKLKREKKHFVNATIFLGLALFILIIIFFAFQKKFYLLYFLVKFKNA